MYELESCLSSLNDINYSIVQGYVLLRLYQAALMVSGGIKPAEPYAVMSFITMVTDIIESPLQSSDGSGSMLMIRIPNKELGKRFYKVLLNTRNRYMNYVMFLIGMTIYSAFCLIFFTNC